MDKNKAKLLDKDPGWLDVLPFFFPASMVLTIPICYYLFDNLMIVIWIGYVIMPLFDYFIPHDDKNLNEVSEKKFEKDKRFLIPMYLFFFLDLILYFW
jgi:hypothetical protein